MPNHVHVIFQPLAEMSKVMRWLKGRTARLSNRILGRTGTTFWQDESFDHWIRSPEEFQDLIAYIENNPVKAGLVDVPRQWRWSSAGLMAETKNDRLPHQKCRNSRDRPPGLSPISSYPTNFQPLRNFGISSRFASSLFVIRFFCASHISLPSTRIAITPSSIHCTNGPEMLKFEHAGVPPFAARIQSR